MRKETIPVTINITFISISLVTVVNLYLKSSDTVDLYFLF